MKIKSDKNRFDNLMMLLGVCFILFCVGALAYAFINLFIR